MAKVYLALNGDNVGSKISETIMSNNPEEVRKVSANFNQAHAEIDQWVEKNGGRVISASGDEAIYEIDDSKINELSRLASNYESKTGHTLTAGVGSDIMEAVKAMVYGKMHDPGQIIQYDEEIDEAISPKEEAQAEEIAEDLDEGDMEEEDDSEELPEDDMEEDDMEDLPEDEMEEEDMEELPEEDMEEDDMEDLPEDEMEEEDDSEELPEDDSEELPEDDMEELPEEDMEEEDDSEDLPEEDMEEEDDSEGLPEEDMEEGEGTDEESGEDEDAVVMPKNKFINEHKKLVDTLRSPEHEDDLKEAEDQEKELEEVQGRDSDADMSEDEDMEESSDIDGEDEVSEEEVEPSSDEEMEDNEAPENMEDQNQSPLPHPYMLHSEEPEEGQDEEMEGEEQSAQSNQELKQRVMQTLMSFKQNKDKIEMMKESDPEMYRNTIDMLNRMIEMARQLQASPDAEMMEQAQQQPPMPMQEEAPEVKKPLGGM
jgi:hypothetical protein